MSEPLVTQRELEGLLRRLRALETRLGQVEVRESPGYATGVYTPTYLGGSTPGTTTYSVQQGSYTRIGNVVFFTATVVWTNATGTGDARISLPFTAANVTNQNFSGSVRLVNVTFASGSPQMQITSNTAYFIMVSPATNAAGTTVAIEAAGNIIASGFYFV